MDADTKPIYGYLQYPPMDCCFLENPIMDISKTISDNLTAWMGNNQDLDTFKKISAKSGVGFGTVQRAKNGDGNITVEKLAAIAEAFKRHPADLITRQGQAYQIEVKTTHSEIKERTPAPVVEFPSALPSELIAIVARMNSTGIQRLIGAAQVLADQFPYEDKGNAQK